MKLFHSELQKTNSKCGKNIIHKKEIATPKDHECTNCVQSWWWIFSMSAIRFSQLYRSNGNTYHFKTR